MILSAFQTIEKRRASPVVIHCKETLILLSALTQGYPPPPEVAAWVRGLGGLWGGRGTRARAESRPTVQQSKPIHPGCWTENLEFPTSLWELVHPTNRGLGMQGGEGAILFVEDLGSAPSMGGRILQTWRPGWGWIQAESTSRGLGLLAEKGA